MFRVGGKITTNSATYIYLLKSLFGDVMTEIFKILSPRDHCRARPGMYLGSVSIEETYRFVLGRWAQVSYVPALNKMVDEVIDNSIDEAIRSNFKYATSISVDIDVDTNTISIEDNGRGIPHDTVIDSTTNKEISKVVAAFCKTNAGTSFGDDRVTIGSHGLGVSLVNFMSLSFIGETWSKGNKITVKCTNGAETIDVKESKKSGNGTKVTFAPDLSLLSVDSISDHDTVALIADRLTSLQMAFPEIKFSLNGQRIAINTIKKYAELFSVAANVTIQKNDLSFFFISSEDGFRTNSFVNGVNTRQGGSYVDFIMGGVIDELMGAIKRKFKVEVSKSTVKSGLGLVLFARNFKNPKFDSQTKERLTNTNGEVKQHYESNGTPDFKYIANKIMAVDDIIQPIIQSELAKKAAADARAASREQNKLKKVKVAKHIAASQPGGTVFICEGDSALSSFLQVRNPRTSGGFPLRGVVANTWDMLPSKVLENKELRELIAVLGLDINKPASVSNMTYQNIAILADADHDGAGHISPLLMAFFYKHWPLLYTQKRIHVTRSPIMISNKGKDIKWFYSYGPANEFKDSKDSKGYHHRYIKGLASLKKDEYDVVINQPVFSTISIDDAKWFDVMFGNDSELRKEVLND